MNTASIWTDKGRCSGKPCIRNTRFTISQLLAEIAEGKSVREVADDFDLDFGDVQGALEEAAMYFDRPWQDG